MFQNFKIFLILLTLFFQSIVVRAQQQSTTITDSIYSNILGEYRTFLVSFPNSYTGGSSVSYPVAYVLDGENFLSTAREVQKFYSGGFTPEMILIGVVNDENRVRDLTISHVETGGNYFAKSGGSDQFREFLETELIPHVDQSFPVTSYRTLIGHSYAGLFALETLLEGSNSFQNYLAIDPSLDWDQEALLNKYKSHLEKGSLSRKSIFISLSGQLHMQNASITLENVMKDESFFTAFPRANISFRDWIETYETHSFYWKWYPQDLHGTVVLPSIMDGLISLFDWYQMEHTDKINSFDTSVEELDHIIQHRADKLNAHFGYSVPPYPEDLLNMSGYMNMDMGQLDKAKMYFETCIKYYPKSPNAYDSMADYYESIGDIELAIENVKKSVSLSDDPYFENRLNELLSKNQK